MTLVIPGTLSELKRKTEAVKTAIATRVDLGIDMFHPDTEWRWFQTSGAPCPRCSELVGTILRGDTIRSTLPHYRVLGPGEIHPEYHMKLGWRTPCYCRLILQNGIEIFEKELHLDKERAIS